MDSGAARSVCPRGFAEHLGTIESEHSKSGKSFRTATGTAVANEGDRTVTGYTDQGSATSMKYVVANVAAALDSISQICDSGSIVVFERTGGDIKRPDGRQIPFERHGDTYRRNVWVKNPAEDPKAETTFSRPGPKSS